eukprot:scaffold153951_cov26-Tisochrysis_lutea.AAC.2
MADGSGRVPVTILTGFLGAGKTTLLRHVLGQKHGLRIAVIQNELSATTGLEAATMRGPNGEWFEKWMELANGCVCCEVRDELPFAIERLMEAKGRFDHVIIETTGMADPGPVAASLWLDDELESPLALDAIITLVDAQHAMRQLDTVESCRQIASADLIVLNKCDCVGEAELSRLSEHLRSINALAPIRSTTHSRLPLEAIFNLHAYERDQGVRTLALAKNSAVVQSSSRRAKEAGGEGPEGGSELLRGMCECCRQPVCSACELPREGGVPADGVGGVQPLALGGAHPRATRFLHRDGRFGTVTLLMGSVPFQLEPLQAYLAALFWEGEVGGEAPLVGEGEAAEKVEVYRAKGVVSIFRGQAAGAGGATNQPSGAPLRYTLQAVHETWELTEATPWEEEDAPESRFVFIGRNLDGDVLRSKLESCRVPSNHSE